MFKKEHLELFYQCLNVINIPGKYIEIAYEAKKELEKELENVSDNRKYDDIATKKLKGT